VSALRDGHRGDRRVLLEIAEEPPSICEAQASLGCANNSRVSITHARRVHADASYLRCFDDASREELGRGARGSSCISGDDSVTKRRPADSISCLKAGVMVKATRTQGWWRW